MGKRIDPNARFETERTRAKQEERARLQEDQEALRRRFAASGLGSSGAAVKTLGKVQARSQDAVGRRLEDIASRQQQEQLRLQEAQDARDFARGEREASQKFASGQQEAQNIFQHRERIGSQQFAGQQAYADRQDRDKQFQFQKEQFGFAKDQALKELDYNIKQALVTNALNFKTLGISQEQGAKALKDLASYDPELANALIPILKSQKVENAKKAEKQKSATLAAKGAGKRWSGF